VSATKTLSWGFVLPIWFRSASDSQLNEPRMQTHIRHIETAALLVLGHNVL